MLCVKKLLESIVARSPISDFCGKGKKSPVCPTTVLRSLIHLDTLNDQVGGVETLGVGVGLSVLQKVDEELGGLDGPAGLGDTELLAYEQILLVNCSLQDDPC